jgi:hypothetical protein
MPYPLPALDFNPDPHSFLDSYSRILQLKNALQQGQMQQESLRGAQLDNQLRQKAIADADALDNAYKGALTTDANGNPTFDRNKVFQSVAASGNGSILPQVQKSFMDLDKLAGDVQKTKDEHVAAAQDYLGA